MCSGEGRWGDGGRVRVGMGGGRVTGGVVEFGEEGDRADGWSGEGSFERRVTGLTGGVGRGGGP